MNTMTISYRTPYILACTYRDYYGCNLCNNCDVFDTGHKLLKLHPYYIPDGLLFLIQPIDKRIIKYMLFLFPSTRLYFHSQWCSIIKSIHVNRWHFFKNNWQIKPFYLIIIWHVNSMIPFFGIVYPPNYGFWLPL